MAVLSAFGDFYLFVGYINIKNEYEKYLIGFISVNSLYQLQ